MTRPVLAVIDGAKALRKAITDVFDQPVIHRCQLHKIRNVEAKLPKRLREVVAKRMRAAPTRPSRRWPPRVCSTSWPRAWTLPTRARPPRCARDCPETLTVLRLGVPPTLARTSRSTNAIESMISICRDHSENLKRWRDGQMALRWRAAGMAEATNQIRRVNGHLHLRKLRDTLDAQVADTVSATCHDEDQKVA